MPGIPAAVQERMKANGLKPGSPGWEIVAQAKLLPAVPSAKRLIGDDDHHALTKLMKAFYEYGRHHWTWTPSSPGSAGTGGLVKGQAHNCACGTFNDNFRWLATNALGIDSGWKKPYAEYNGQFLTHPGQSIDSRWPGNVRTPKVNFGELHVYKLSKHFWAEHGGHGYDVCYNKVVAGPQDAVLTKLTPADPALSKKLGLPERALFKINKPLVADHDYLIAVTDDGVNGWPEFMMVPEHDLVAVAKRVKK